MKSSSKVLLALAAVLVLAAVLLRPQSDSDTATTDLLMPELQAQLEQVTKVELVTAGNNAKITLVKADGFWGLEQRAGYRIEFDRLRSILRALAQLKTAEAMTSNPQYFDRLHLVDVADANSNAKAIRIYGEDGNKVAGLLLGDSLYRGDTEYTYIRVEGDNQSWLVAGGLDLWLTPTQWLDKDLLDIEREQINAVEVSHADGETLTVKRETDENGQASKDLLVQNVPSGKELLYPSVGNGPAEALQNLRLDDVQAASSFGWQPDNIVTTRLTRKDGITIVTQAERRETEYFLAISVEYAGEDDELKAEAEKLSNQFKGWVYSIQPYKYQALAKRVQQMLKDE
jgi:hypothetical protein